MKRFGGSGFFLGIMEGEEGKRKHKNIEIQRFPNKDVICKEGGAISVINNIKQRISNEEKRRNKSEGIWWELFSEILNKNMAKIF